ncbi:hypothetical protein PC113_g16570 [Phytophthora cactorum]|uniref:DDE-1 domain-containing protein n=1 Tax=Phytophthora cactorum TaxID=29920 RepID=A0A8T0YKI9_9STRA|nr:hypothetical protein PC113_g16570 [Phytophthora cactorum]
MCVTSQWLLLMLFALSTGRSLDAAVVSIRRFRLRNRLSVRVITHRGTKKRSELQEVADKFSRTITYNLEMVGLIAGIQGADRYESVFNMDQTSIYIDMGPKRTTELNLSEPKMWMLFKECHKTRLKAYCDEERMIEWIKEVWKPSVTAPRLLLLDSLKSHRINSVRDVLEKECCTSVEFIPPGITGLALPMDVSVMKEFKNLCKNYCVNYHAVNDFAQMPLLDVLSLRRLLHGHGERFERK